MATDFFIKIGDVKGESEDEKHKDWIDILSWSWGLSNMGTVHLGRGAGGGKMNVQDLSFTKFVDFSSPTLAQFCANGKHVPKATFVARKAGEKPLEYLKFELETILVSSYQTGGSGGDDRVTESISLNFSKIKVHYWEQTKEGTAGADKDITIDIPENKVT